MNILFDQGRLLFKKAQPIAFEFSSKNTGHKVQYQLLDRYGAVLKAQTLLSPNDRIELNYDPATQPKCRVMVNVDFSQNEDGQYEIKVLGGENRNQLALFQIRQGDNKSRILFDLEGDPVVDPPDED